MANIEVIAFCKEDIDIINKTCVNRIELVKELENGGLTPELELIKYAKKHTNKPIRIMIRPHCKNFIYSDEDIKIMQKEIELAKLQGCDGVVFGALTEDNKIDINVMKKLIIFAKPMKITFHRAIDDISLENLKESLEILEKLEVDTILTSLGHNEEDKILRYNILKNTKIEVMYGAGLTLSNIENMKEKYPFNYYHFGKGVREDNSLNKKISLENIEKVITKL